MSTNLDPGQAVKNSYDEGSQSFKVSLAGGISIGAVTINGANGTPVNATANGLQVDGSAVTQPVSATSLPLPAGAATSAKQDTGNTSLASIDSKLTSPLAVTGTFFQATQPISAVALPLPSGASTSALQTTGNASLTSIDSKLTSPLAVTGTFFQATQPVSGTVTANAGTGTFQTNVTNASIAVTGTFFQATQPVSAASLPLPTGAATSALQTQISGQLPSTLGQKASADSLSVVLASNQSVLPVSQGGYALSQFVRNDYTITPVTTSAYVQLVASTSNVYQELRIFDSSGFALELATGAAASEVPFMIIPPGGFDSPIKFTIAASTRISIKALATDAIDGEIDITFFG